jgi:hypothetical protein
MNLYKQTFYLSDRPLFNIGGLDDYIHTPFASIRRQCIEPLQKQNADTTNTPPTSIGSRIGVVYSFKQKSIHMHCILNGFDYGPFAILNIESPSIENDEIFVPSKKRQRTCLVPNQSINEHTKFWAFVDVYGATKRVRILQLYGRKYSKTQSISLSILFIFSKYIEKFMSLNDSL